MKTLFIKQRFVFGVVLLISFMWLAIPVTPAVAQTENCTNGLDDDNDGYIDQFDSECMARGCYAPLPAVTSLQADWSSTGGINDRVAPQAADMDGDSISEIIAFTGTGYRMYEGDGSNLASTTTDFATGSIALAGEAAIGDLDNNGSADLVAINATNRYIYAYSISGTELFTSSVQVDIFERFASPRLADFNQDGNPEILVGNSIFNGQTGVLIASAGTSNPAGATINLRDPVAADILPTAFCADCSGLELVVGRAIYSVNIGTGTLVLQVSAIGLGTDGPTAVADMDLDGDLDVIYADNTNLNIWDGQTSIVLHQGSISGGTTSALPLIANVYDDTQDGHAKDLPEALIVTPNLISAFNDNYASALWTLTVPDAGGASGLAAFDFDGDGFQEIVYNDDNNLRIINGNTTSPVNIASLSNAPTSFYQYPIIADVDNDQEVEIVAVGNGELHVIEPASGNWLPGRDIWNQRGYRVVNINDNATVPQVEQGSEEEIPLGSDQALLNRSHAQTSTILRSSLRGFCATGTGPGGIGQQGEETAPELWLQAGAGAFSDDSCSITAGSSDPIGCWADQSGNNQDATQSTAVAQPSLTTNALNGHPAITFDGSDELRGSFFSGVDEASLFVVGDLGQTDNGYFEAAPATTTDTGWSFFNSGSTTLRRVLTSNEDTTETYAAGYNLYSVAIENDLGGIWVNGTAATQSTVTGTIATNNNYIVGSLFDSTFPATGNIPELIVYGSELNTVQRTLVENYLSAKYDLAISNDVYDGDSGINGDFDQHVAGIGLTADDENWRAHSAGIIVQDDTYLQDAGDYLVFGHKTTANSNTTDDVPTTGLWDGTDDVRWARHWYFDRTDQSNNGGVVDITFDYSEAGMDGDIAKLPAGDATNYRLLRRANATGQFEDITATCTAAGATISGDQVIFAAVDVTCLGSNFTLGSLDSVASPTAVTLQNITTAGNTSFSSIVIVALLMVVATAGLAVMWKRAS